MDGKEAFASLLDWHIRNGSRPRATEARGPWKIDEIAYAVGLSGRTISNYRSGQLAPKNIEHFVAAFFGEDPEKKLQKEQFLDSHKRLWSGIEDAKNKYSLSELNHVVDFSYLSTKLDQLPGGAWGKSVAPWIVEAGNYIEGFRLNPYIGVEGGIETTALCVEALASILRSKGVVNQSWSDLCRSHFRKRQDISGAIGYLIPGYKDPAPVVQATYRHTAHGAFSLIELGSREPMVNRAVEHLVKGICPSGRWNAPEVARCAREIDRFPAMLLGTMLAILIKIKRHNDMMDMENKIDCESAINSIKEALFSIDKDEYPFFSPYAGVKIMDYYSFLSVLNIIGSEGISFIRDRARDGINRILEESSCAGGIPFSSILSVPDVGMTASFLNIFEKIYNEEFSEDIESRNKNFEYRVFKNNVRWISENIDSYNKGDREFFKFFQSGTFSRILLLRVAKVRLADLTLLAALDEVVRQISMCRRSAPQGKIDCSVKEALGSIESLAGRNLEAMTALLTERIVY